MDAPQDEAFETQALSRMIEEGSPIRTMTTHLSLAVVMAMYSAGISCFRACYFPVISLCLPCCFGQVFAALRAFSRIPWMSPAPIYRDLQGSLGADGPWPTPDVECTPTNETRK
jgi:hypothetical protein